ncbi:hypothetical protein PNEG_00950 [Pneumocystis murina B123]|uniref:Ribosome quality control complex subunit 2 n=1 Tax=Pneumocystis murina (strain B123) TaxID=1069680 RepID=M7NQ32_PNEMU|nr:hypothetical protein PNEG_00950 [Pneumocystis murina B123]EMR10803.1 hypothetical protein PNEG_00950 [Pneumocystis murina B123]
MKQRLNILDLKSVVSELQELLEFRLQNIYDISERIFQFKFSSSGRKEYLLVECGSRIHLTRYVRETAALPSQFCAKLRKHLKNRQLVSLKHICNDRIVYLGFGRSNETKELFKAQYYLIFEFYASGNIILADENMKILFLYRMVVFGDKRKQFSVGEIYHVSSSISQDEAEMTKDSLLSLIHTLKDKYITFSDDVSSKNIFSLSVCKKALKKGKTLKDFPLKKFISWELSGYGNSLIEHIIRDANIDPDMKLDEFYSNLESINMDDLLLSFKKADDIIRKCRENPVTGYIVEKKEPIKVKSENLNNIQAESTLDYIRIYLDFNPFIPKQFSDNPDYSIIAYDNYNSCIDMFFSSLESQKFDMKLKHQEDLAYRRLQATKEELQKKIDDLKKIQNISIQKAVAIEENLEIVDETIKAVNDCLLQSMDWNDIAKLIENEKEYGNPAAKIISLPLKLKLNTITIKLSSVRSDDAFEQGQDSNLFHIQKDRTETLDIDIKLSMNAWANARDYYDKKKLASIKEKKTVAASFKALKNAERKIKFDLKKSAGQEKKKIVPMRTLRWFEKFLWFISSDGYLVLGGRDSLQDKILIKDHFFENDIYVHADLKDASVVIIKNMHDSLFVPPSTLSQAGAFSISKSNAWTSKIVTSAWWVRYDQVIKHEDVEEQSLIEVFTIQGKKNFLPPSQLILGYGILWVVDEDSKVRRLKNKLSENNQNNSLINITLNQEATFVTEKIIDLSLNHEEKKVDITDTLDKSFIDNFEESSNQNNPLIYLKDTLIEKPLEEIENESKYNLEEYHEPLSLESKKIISDICTIYQKIEKKRMSFKERRDIKNMQMKTRKTKENPEKTKENPEKTKENPGKTKVNSGNTKDQNSESLNIKVGTEISNSKPLDTNKTKENGNLLSTNVRGKKGKIKKIMLKYADQDENDRILRMKLLGSNISSEKKDLKENKKSIVNKKHKANKDIKNTGGNNNYNNKKEIFQNNSEKKNNHLLVKENIKVPNNKEKNYEINLDAFVPFPLSDDVLVEAIPICAPYSSMAKYKYKIKLQPGSTKKGKAIRSIIAYWNALPIDLLCEDDEKVFPRERELIQSLKDSELLSPVYIPTLKTMMGKSKNDIFSKTNRRKHF